MNLLVQALVVSLMSQPTTLAAPLSGCESGLETCPNYELPQTFSEPLAQEVQDESR